MAGQDNRFAGKGEHLFANPADEKFMIAVGEIGPANPAAEQHIAPEQNGRSFEFIVIEGAKAKAVG